MQGSIQFENYENRCPEPVELVSAICMPGINKDWKMKQHKYVLYTEEERLKFD